jgi:membrane protein
MGAGWRIVERVDGFQRRHRVIGFPLAVVYKFFDDQGNHLAALMAYFAFLATFPLLLLGTSILGFVLQGNPELEQTIVDSALRQFPVIGDQLAAPEGLQGSGVGLVVGAAGALYAALGVSVATQNAINVAWAVPRNHRPNPIMLRVRGLGLLSIAGTTVLANAVLAALGSYREVFGVAVGDWPRSLIVVVTVALNATVFAIVFRLGTTHDHRLVATLPGAVLASVLWQGMQFIGARFIDAFVRDANVTNQIFAVVLGLVVWIYIGAIMTVLCVELNVVRERHLYPRALLTPFTDNVDLTDADIRAYASYADAQRTKDFATVRVRFEHDGQNATVRAQRREAPPDPADPGDSAS